MTDMTDWTTLVGKFFYIFEDGVIKYQGEVLGEIQPGSAEDMREAYDANAPRQAEEARQAS